MQQSHDTTLEKPSSNRPTIEQLYEQFHIPIYCFILKRTSDKELAEDITQEVFTRAYLHLDETRQGSSYKTWLFSIATNLMIDHWRKRSNYTIPLDIAVETAEIEDPIDDMERVASRENIGAALDMMEEQDRQMLILRYGCDMDNRTISHYLNMTVGAVRTKQMRARRHFRAEYVRLTDDR